MSSKKGLNKTDATDLEAVAEQQDAPKEEAKVEIIGALEDRYGDWHLAIGCC
jgi:hypothetical protein